MIQRNEQVTHQIIVKIGAIIDISLKPKGKTNYKVTEERKGLEEVEVIKEYVAGVDKEEE